MPRVGSRSGARDRVFGATLIVSGARVSALGGTIIVVSMVLISAGCAAVPGGGAQATSTPTSTPPESSPTATPSGSAETGASEWLDFADGAQLDPLAMVGWSLSIEPDGAEWTLDPEAQPGETTFVNADSTCTAYFHQEVFETAAVDDRAASGELLVQMTGFTAEEVEEYAADEYFVLNHSSTPEVADGRVANRSLLADGDGKAWLVAARVFTNLDYETSTMNNAYSLELGCDATVDPMTQLSSLDEIAQITVGH